MNEIVQSFEKITKVVIVPGKNGYYLKRQSDGAVLDITFDSARAATMHAIANFYVITFDDK
ncbi:MAG: hypothetical protein ACXV8O_14690 [Methylobacter sp.]